MAVEEVGRGQPFVAAPELVVPAAALEEFAAELAELRVATVGRGVEYEYDMRDGRGITRLGAVTSTRDSMHARVRAIAAAQQELPTLTLLPHEQMQARIVELRSGIPAITLEPC